MAQLKGKVAWFNNAKGYGFISYDGGADVFVHYTGIVSEQKFKYLDDGDPVEFDVVLGSEGKPQAVNVTILKS